MAQLSSQLRWYEGDWMEIVIKPASSRVHRASVSAIAASAGQNLLFQKTPLEYQVL
jgi:hypothetical protein